MLSMKIKVFFKQKFDHEFAKKKKNFYNENQGRNLQEMETNIIIDSIIFSF